MFSKILHVYGAVLCCFHEAVLRHLLVLLTQANPWHRCPYKERDMISAIDNNKNQYYEKVGAVQFQAQRGYSAEFQKDLQRRTEEPTSPRDAQRIERTFGSLLTYGRSNAKNADGTKDRSEFNLLHPNVKDDKRAQKFDFVA